jgi:hypothetical protein
MGSSAARSWRVVAASVQGSSHSRVAQPCQDAHVWMLCPDGVLIAAVADGAGSARFGEAGAAVAARAAVEAAAAMLATAGSPSDDNGWRVLLEDALVAARSDVAVAAVARQASTDDLATTLILVVATPLLVAAGQIGDGAVVTGSPDGQFTTLTAPRFGEYINETDFLTSGDGLDRAQVAIQRVGALSVAVLSDGLQLLALKIPGATPHSPFFAPLFRFCASASDSTTATETLAEFLRSSRVQERTDDDLTLLLATFVD